MSKLTIFLLLIIILGTISLIFFIIYSKLMYLQNKTKYVSELIDDDLEKKYKNLVKINNQIKKTLHAKKDYLIDINNLSDKVLSSQEKDITLEEYNNTVNNLINDYSKLTNNKVIKKQVTALYEINEKLDASKTYFNKYMTLLSESSIKFPCNIVTKIMKIKIKPLYETNETIKKINNEEL